MRIPRLAIENYQFSIIILLTLVAMGVLAFFTMPRSEDPAVAKPGASVIVLYPGATPLDMEQLVVEPIETAMNELEDIKKITARAGDGWSGVYVEFLVGSDPDEKYSDIVQKVNSIRDQLPDEIFALRTQKWQVNDVSILQLALVSDSSSYRELENETERLKKRLERVPGVRNVDTWAFPEQEVHLSLNLEKMAQLRLSIQQVQQVIESENLNIPGGHLDLGDRRFNVQTSGTYQSLDDIRNTIIHSDGTKLIYLKDIATVEMDYEDLTYFARFNQHKAVWLTLTQKEKANIFNVMNHIKDEINDFQKTLSPKIQLKTVFDQSQSVAYRLNGFFMNLLQGVLLVGIVIFLAMNVRAAIIVMLAIPISILIGIGFVDVSGYGFQQMTIAGLVIVLGILVDNAIVVTENIIRYLRKGLSFTEAAITGTNEIGWPIVSATITTVLSFVPLMMIGDVTGDYIRSMPVTVVFTLVASLLVALTLTPYLATRILKKEAPTRRKFFPRLLNRIIEKQYRQTLKYALSHRKLVVFLTLFVFVGSLALFRLVGISFFPKAEKPQFLIDIEAPEGTSLAKTEKITRDVEALLARRDEIKHFAANIGKGNPRIYYNVLATTEMSNRAQLFVELKNRDLDLIANLIRDLRQKFLHYPGAKIEVQELEQGPPVEAPIAVKLLGKNLSVLRTIARDVEAIVAETPGTININNPLRTTKTDLQVKINREKAALFGVPIAVIDQTVRACVAGISASNYRDSSGKEYQIVLSLPDAHNFSISDFEMIYVPSLKGMQVPLKQLATIELKSSPLGITHYNLKRSVTIAADVVGDVSVDGATRQVIDQLEKYNWPRGYRFVIGGELESRQESFGGLYLAVLIASLGILAVLVLQFKSFSQPLIVFSAVPLAVVGSILALLITGYSFSFTAFVGLTSLVGIVVNNSIILVDYSNQLVKNGSGFWEAIQIAGETRFQPIILTTGTTIGGLLPLTLQGGTLWAPMGWTIIGGLLVSTVLTLVVVPVLYSLLSPAKAS